jgi:hypothetical protein
MYSERGLVKEVSPLSSKIRISYFSAINYEEYYKKN